MENIQLPYPGYYLFYIVLIAIIFALGLYFRDKRVKENVSWLPYALGLLRFLSILGILFLLLGPLIKKFVSVTQKPIIVIAQDESQSISLSTDESILTQVSQGIADLKTGLADKFDIKEIRFAENLVFNPEDSLDVASSNLSSPLEYISDTYEDQNLGAIILCTDGIYNEGKNPTYANTNFAAPLYSIPLGDTTIRRDILVKNILHNRIVYLNDKFLIEADIQAYNAVGVKSRVDLFRVDNGNQIKLDSKSFVIDKNNYFNSFQFEIDANRVGNNKYIIAVSGISNELSTSNNRRSAYIEVLDARQKILIISASTHPDIKALKSIITNNKNYEVEVTLAKDSNKNIRSYDIIIMHNLPNNQHDVSNYLSEIKKLKKPVFYVVGAETNLQKLMEEQDVFSHQGGNNSLNEVTPLIDNSFNLFTLSDNVKAKTNRFVPLKVPFGEFSTNSTSKVLLHQKIGNVETKYPLLAYSDLNGHKQAVLAGEGIWRWRLMEYAEYKEQALTSELIGKTLQYISQKEDKRQFRAFTNKNTFKENENILFDAQLYNANYEQINDPEAYLTVTNEKGEKFEYTFSKSNNYYFLDGGRFPEGNYEYVARTSFNNKNLTASGKFNVQSILKEQFDLTAKHNLLYNLSEKYGGQVIYPDQINTLQEILASHENIKPILYQKAETKSVLDLKWILAAIILLLAIEWFVRRYFGGY